MHGCKKPIEPLPEKDIYPPRLNITDAKAIFTFDANNNRENVFKITNENIVDTVKYINTDGQTIFPNPTVFGIGRNIGIVNIWGLGVADNFILIDSYHNQLWDENGEPTNNYNLSVIEKKTGIITDIIRDSLGSSSFDMKISLQKSNYYYYFRGAVEKYMYKLDHSNILEQIISTNNAIWSFFVNSNDFILYKVSDENYNMKYSLQSPSGNNFSINNNMVLRAYLRTKYF
jgi:hypothetical protein